MYIYRVYVYIGTHKRLTYMITTNVVCFFTKAVFYFVSYRMIRNKKKYVVVDNVGGHLMQHGLVDLVITGSDRTTYTGDVANKIGTYLKALAAHDNGSPFYVALPSSTFDWETRDGVKEIPIEQRNGDEVSRMGGAPDAELSSEPEIEVNVVAQGSPVANYAFDVTPSRLVTGLVTERGVCPATESGIHALFPEK